MPNPALARERLYPPVVERPHALVREEMPIPLERIAVIDLGSNSGRAIVVEPHPLGYLHVVDEVSAPLELTRALDAKSRLSDEAMERVLQSMAGFVAVARSAGAREILAVGTSALRRAVNAPRLLDEIERSFGVRVEVVDGATEARYAFQGAVYPLPVEGGLVIDIGGGSLELVRFEGRTLVDSWSFPFGALRLTDEFFAKDPPGDAAMQMLADAVRSGLADASVGRIRRGEQCVGTGGSIRNLAKIDVRPRRYPIARLHGYTLRTSRVQKLVASLAVIPPARRGDVPGLNPQRSGTIVAGAVALHATLQHVRASEIVVSGQGLREGIARRDVNGTLPRPEAVRQAAVHALTERLSGWDEVRAERRTVLARELATALLPDAGSELVETIRHAATLLDVGAAIDVYNRHRETAAIVLRTDLSGFSHRQLAMLAAVVQLAERPSFDLASLRPLVASGDRRALTRAAAVLALADEIVRYTPATAPCAWRVDGGALRLQPLHAHWAPAELIARLRDALDLEVGIENPRG